MLETAGTKSMATSCDIDAEDSVSVEIRRHMYWSAASRTLWYTCKRQKTHYVSGGLLLSGLRLGLWWFLRSIVSSCFAVHTI